MSDFEKALEEKYKLEGRPGCTNFARWARQFTLKETEMWAKGCAENAKTIATLTALLDEAEKALVFYADPNNWQRWHAKPGEERRHFPANATIFQYSKAPEALAKIRAGRGKE